MLSCQRCRLKVPVREAMPELLVDWVPTDSGTSQSADEPVTEQSVYVRRRYYSRTKLPKNLPPKKKARRRRLRKTKFTRGDLIKTVLGALIALPVAQLILWWGLARDPFSLGPTVASVAPFLVPRPMRGDDLTIPAKPAEYLSHPDTNLVQGAPFQFDRDPSPTVADDPSLEAVFPKQAPKPILNSEKFAPLVQPNESGSSPKR
jgi:hypothetical protein